MSRKRKKANISEKKKKEIKTQRETKGNIREREEGKQNKKKQNRQKKIILVCVLLAILLIYVIYIVFKLIENPTDTFMLENGTLYQEETTTGYIIRNETVVKGENYKNGMIQIKTEGERVAKDEPIFRYYSSGEENLRKKIEDLDTKIQEAMSKEEGIFSADIKLLETQIETKLNSVYELNDMQKVKEYKRDINSYITKKAKIAGEYSPSGSYLKKLIDERSSYENQLNSGAEYLKAPLSGIVSYRVDGLEEVLSPTDFGSLSKSLLEDLNLKTGQIIASSEESGKIIDNYSCYIAFLSKSEEAKSKKVGNTVKIRLPSNTEINATIQYITDEGDSGKLIVLELNKAVEELINYRKISFDIIWWSANGLKVPNSAIKQENNLSYVVRNRNGYTDTILVKILKQNDKYAIVTNYNSEELKEMGYDYQQIIKMKKISIYDEVILKPNQ